MQIPRKAGNYELFVPLIKQLKLNNRRVSYRETDEHGVLESTISVCNNNNDMFTIHLTMTPDTDTEL